MYDFIQKNKDSNKKFNDEYHVIELVQGRQDNDQVFFAYVAIPHANLLAFKYAEQQGNYDLEEYGEILSTGNSLIPLPKTYKQMQKKYRINNELKDEIVKEILDAA